MNDYLISYYFQCGEKSGFGSLTITIDKITVNDLNAIVDNIKTNGKKLYDVCYEGVTIFNVVKLDKE